MLCRYATTLSSLPGKFDFRLDLLLQAMEILLPVLHFDAVRFVPEAREAPVPVA